jgi:glycogen(starch) synthase
LGRPFHLTLKRLEDHVIQGSDAVLCPSHFLARQAEVHYGLGDGAVTRIPLPIGDTEHLPRTDETWRSGTICYVGRMEARKGVFEWIEAVIALARERPGLRFEFIGADTDLVSGSSGVRDAVASRLPNELRLAVSFLDALPRAELLARLSQARIVVVPSRWENFPNTCLEAMSTGVPVLASSEGGMVEMIQDGVTGWIATGASPHSLAAGLRRALDTPAAQIAAMGRAAAESVRVRFGNDSIVDRHVEFRSRVAAAGPRRSLTMPRTYSGLMVMEAADAPPASVTTAVRRASPAGATASQGRGIAIIVTDLDRAGIDGCVESLTAQTRPVAAVIIGADAATGGPRDRAEQQLRNAGLTVLACAPQPAGTQPAVRRLLETPGDPMGIALVPGDCTLAPQFVERVEAALSGNESVGLVSGWAEPAEPGLPLFIRPSPQRPYQWFLNDLAATCVFRTAALRPLAWILDSPAEAQLASVLALAVLLDGWTSLTVPDVLCTEGRSRGPLHVARDAAVTTRMLRLLQRGFPDLIAADAAQAATVAYLRLDVLARQNDERQRWIVELENGKAWLEGQRDAWEASTHKLERLFTEQAAWIEKLEQDKKWLESERQRWEQLASKRGQS